VRERVLSRLDELQGLAEAPSADGAFYCLLRVHTSVPSVTLAERLIREHRVATVPGTTFGLEEGCYLRVSYGALAPESVEEGMNRLVQGLRALVG
jgi:aspartate/methionine/tyrosine aminotransferase